MRLTIKEALLTHSVLTTLLAAAKEKEVEEGKEAAPLGEYAAQATAAVTAAAMASAASVEAASALAMITLTMTNEPSAE